MASNLVAMAGEPVLWQELDILPIQTENAQTWQALEMYLVKPLFFFLQAPIPTY